MMNYYTYKIWPDNQFYRHPEQNNVNIFLINILSTLCSQQKAIKIKRFEKHHFLLDTILHIVVKFRSTSK